MRRRRTKRRTRRRSGGRRQTIVPLLATLIVAALVLTPSGAFTSSTVPRSSGFDAVSDDEGLVGLAVTTEVSVGSTEWLVNATNNYESSVTVTVTLDPSATDVGDLVVDGSNVGDSATFTLAGGGSETVEIQVPQDCSLGDRSVPFSVEATAADLDVTADRSSQVGSTLGLRDSVAFHDQGNNELHMLERDGTLTNFGFTTKGFGPADADFDCDGKMEIPYVDGNSGITIIDVDSETQTLVSSDVRNDVVLGVGDFDGDDKSAVVYPNAGDNNQIYRVEHNGDNVEVAAFAAVSIAGIADFNGDGDQDIVYTSTGNHDVRYYDNGTEYGTGVSAACQMCIGAPMDFDGDGAERVPFKHKNDGEIMLVDAEGNTETVWNGEFETLGSLGSFDWNDDGTPDIVIVSNNDKRLYWIDYTDGSLNGPIQDNGGNDVTGDAYGVA